VGRGAACLDSSTSRFDVYEMNNEENKTDTYMILRVHQFYTSLCRFQLRGKKLFILKKGTEIHNVALSIGELGLRIRAIINSPACMIIKGEKKF
jgi:hypothetical protein